jgi:branched-chain amino acid transport system ATP-binding protein
MLDARDLHTFYGASHVLHGASVSVQPGEIVAVVGRNGMGKTTLIRSIAGLTPPRQGVVVFRGRQVQGRPAYEIARLGMALVPQGRRIFPSLTVEENLVVAARRAGDGVPGSAGGAARWSLEAVYGLFGRLKERRRNKGTQLSGGEQQMLAIGRALMTNPTCLLMDEPSEGLAPRLVEEVGNVLAELRRNGLGVLLVEQNLPMVRRVADAVRILNKGVVVFTGTPAELAARPDVLAAHLAVEVTRSPTL